MRGRNDFLEVPRILSLGNVLAPRNFLSSAANRRIYQICKADTNVTWATNRPTAKKRRALKFSMLRVLAKRISSFAEPNFEAINNVFLSESQLKSASLELDASYDCHWSIKKSARAKFPFFLKCACFLRFGLRRYVFGIS